MPTPAARCCIDTKKSLKPDKLRNYGKISYTNLTSTNELIRGCQRNDRKAQGIFFHRYKEKILLTIVKILGSDTSINIEDTVQQSFISVFKSIHRFQFRSSIDTWIYAICQKTCMTQLRKKYAKRQLQLVANPEDILLHAPAGGGSSPDHRIEQKELRQSIFHALDKIHPQRRMTFILFEIEKRPIEEISSLLGCAVGTVKSRLFRARNDLQRLLLQNRPSMAN